jgi:Secretion system C-terminal sorting domain/Dockerin type I domain/Bacterial Ig domain
MNIPIQYITRLFVAAIVAGSPAFLFAQTVDAVDDIVHTLKNTSITFDPLINDNGSGTLRLDKVVLENHGKTSIQNGKIVFTPNTDFKGAALLNYTMCDSRNQCACGLVIIDISEQPLPVYQEMKIFVDGTTTTKFTLPANYTFPQQASNGGSIAKDNSTGEWLFKASEGFKGITRRTFDVNDVDGVHKTYEVEFEVLPSAPQYVMPDLVSTKPGEVVRFNVLDNDDKNNISSINFGACTGGTLITSTDGSVVFTPTLIDGGIASFDYTVTVTGGKTETARATIFVSNYLPSKEQFSLNSSGNPLVIRYPVPIKGFNFKPLSEKTPFQGVIKYYTSIDTMFGDEHVVGNNLLIYFPNVIANGGRNFVDNFWVKYCTDNTCSEYFQVYVNVEDTQSGDQCIADCVWPGDANGDGLVNILDIFPIAQNMGQYGKIRALDLEYFETRNKWYPHRSLDWGKTSFGRDMKFVDTNGDGIITAADIQAIVENYGNNSTLTPIKTAAESNIEIQLVSSVGSLIPGDMIEMTVSMGSSEMPAFNTKGISFSLEYNPNQIKENTITTDFSAFTWLSRYDAYLSLSKIVERGKLDAGLVRSKGKVASGHGEVGKLRAVVEDNIYGVRADDKATVKFHLANAYMVGDNGQPVKLQTKDLEIPLKLGKKADVLQAQDLVMYPNPASDMVNFHINGVNKIDYVRIMDGAGREVVRVNGVDAKSASIPVGDLRGFYIAEVMTEKGRVVKKLEIFKN